MSFTMPEWAPLHADAWGHGWSIGMASVGYRQPQTYTARHRETATARTFTDPAALRAWVAGGCMDGYALNQIVTGDARQLADSLPDQSVNLIFTDPVYQNIDDYAWLAETARRVLRPRGVVLAWCSVPKLGKCQQAMEDAGLEYVYTLFYTVVAKTHRMRWYNLFCWTTPCLWFQLPGQATRPQRWMPETYQDTIIHPRRRRVLRMVSRSLGGNTAVSSTAPSGAFAWNKNTGVLLKWLTAFSRPGDVVWDPFTGTGPVPAVCKATGRDFYASERDTGRAEEARARLAATPEPLAAAPAAELIRHELNLEAA